MFPAMIPRRVLVLVPDLFFAARIAETARAAGVTIESASPAAAAERCRAVAPDLVILDLHAAGDPLDAVRALKSDPATLGIPVVGFHSHVDTELRERALAAGVDRVLPRSAFTVRLAALLTGEKPG